MWMGILLLPTLLAAKDNDATQGGLGEGIDMVASTGTLFGVIIVVVAVGLWLMPIAFAGLVYTGQKKKAEQMHEEVGLKAAILSLLAGVLGAAMSYYVVGTIGMYSDKDANNLKQGNGALLSVVIGSGVDKMTK